MGRTHGWILAAGLVLMLVGAFVFVRQLSGNPGESTPTIRVADAPSASPTASPSPSPVEGSKRPRELVVSQPRAAGQGTFAPKPGEAGVPRARRARDAHPERAPFAPTSVSFNLASGTATAPVDRVQTLGDGSLELPEDPQRMGWWSGSSPAGTPYGSVVVAGHLDSRLFGVGFAAHMAVLARGDVVLLTDADQERRYRVRTRYLLPRTRLSALAALFSDRGPARLVLITCGGTYDRARGAYSDNFVVEATPLR